MAAPNQQLSVRERTQALVEDIKSEKFSTSLSALLGKDISLAKFQQVTTLALQMNPDLVTKADKKSLLMACMQAAKSKLIPDGKQGALVMYGRDVQWQPMIAGLRILLARRGFDLRTEVVYENDEFDYDLGDEPRITHKRPKFGTPRGAMIGVYAIARGPDGKLYRRVMDMEAIAYVRSKAKSGAVWTNWPEPMAEKTVGRALVKQLPIYDDDDDLREAIEADNANFNLDTPAKREPSKAAQAAAAAAKGEAPAATDVVDVEFTEAPTAEAPTEDPANGPADPAPDRDPLDDIPF